MMKSQFKTLFAGAVIMLFALSCGTEPAAETNENEIIDSEESEVSVQEENAVANAVDGSMKIAELHDKMHDLEGKTVQITGTCTKINSAIMGRNWIHLVDGSKDDFDLIVTSDIHVPEGSKVTMTGVVALNKDFGAGYQYELILEEGKLIE